MLIIKILFFFCLFSIAWFSILILGEITAIKNKYPRFTKWWRRNWVGLEDDLY